ncbi:MAG: transcriptional repressor [Rhodospirillales bacterium]|nr:transcriptional repressor [Rhodospirillales bacterium]
MTAHSPRRTAARLDAAALSCAREGVALTNLRRQVLGLILEAGGPLTAYQLLDRLKKTRKQAVPPTIYRALDFLMARRLIHKIESLNAFIPCIEPTHATHQAQFLICQSCGTVIELEDHAVSRALGQATARRGFHVTHALVEVTGECAACAQAAA